MGTDRAVSARGAWEALKQLTGDARSTFAAYAYAAIRNAVENDRREAQLWSIGTPTAASSVLGLARHRFRNRLCRM